MTIKKYMSLNPSSFKLPFEPVPELEEKYSLMPLEMLRKAFSKTVYENIENKSWCMKCKIVKEPRAHHCKICNKYI